MIRIGIRLTLLLLLFGAGGPVVSQELPFEDPAAEESSSPLVGAAWCVVRSSGADPDKARATGDPGDPGCDAGVGLALARWRRLSWVAVLGTGTTGTGIAWVAHRPADGSGPVFAVAAGAVVRYDSSGIDGGKIYLALGATVSFARHE